MKTGDNFKDFLKKNVPDHLKKKALRKLWLTNPIFGYLDGMNEYDEDFTLATSALEEFATNYVVGKGFKGQFKPDPDCTNSDILEDDTLNPSSVRLDEKNKELVNNEEYKVNKVEINDEYNYENNSDSLENSQMKEENEKDKNLSAKDVNIDNIDTNDAVNVDLLEENINFRIKPKKMIFKV